VTSSAGRKHTLTRVIARYLSGRDLDGQRRTNATFLQRADRDLTPHGRASAWAHKRHAERAAWRIIVAIAVSATLYGFAFARTVTVMALTSAGFTSVAVGAWWLAVTIRTWTHNRRIVRPLYKTLAPIAGHPPNDSYSRYLMIPRDFSANEKAKVKLMLSPLWEGSIAQQKQITGLVARRLAGDWDSHYFHHATPPFVEFRHSPAPPAKVTYAAFKPYMDKSPAHILVLGIGANDKLISIDLDSEAPHIALSIGTGGGKTVTMAQIIAFLVKNGVERIDIIDTKRAGYSWCINLPGVYVHRTMTAQMEAIHNVRVRMEERYEEIGEDENRVFPRNVLIIEEQNTWIKYAEQYWNDLRQEMEQKERSRAPKKNPAITDIGFVLFMGRQACVNVISIFQRMSASAAGGGDMRDQYGAKLLARFSPQSWKILVGTTPIPRSSRINGRAIFVLGDETHAVQLAYLTQDEATEYALSGNTVNVSGPGTPVAGKVINPDDELYSLRELVDSNVIPIKYGALRKARQRDKSFPEPVKRGAAMLYTPDVVKKYLVDTGRIRVAA
jgi:hypothetical protein